ncbi:MAG TPA: hypothetical protein VHX86_18230 [Tepidisphaeraceae bacterium]|nr:hypothetical protein [Tepidisphaeraceae bacterium]
MPPAPLRNAGPGNPNLPVLVELHDKLKDKGLPSRIFDPDGNRAEPVSSIHV